MWCACWRSVVALCLGISVLACGASQPTGGGGYLEFTAPGENARYYETSGGEGQGVRASAELGQSLSEAIRAVLSQNVEDVDDDARLGRLAHWVLDQSGDADECVPPEGRRNQRRRQSREALPDMWMRWA